MKEFYKFIGSRDIREHLAKIDYEMSASECAFVVAKSMLSLEGKHKAYKKIIDTMKDAQLPDNGGSLHDVLKTKMELENILMDVFEQEDRAVYVYSYLDREEGREVYADWSRCLNEAFEWCEDADFVRIEKRWITVGNETPKSVSVLFNVYREVVNVSSRSILSDDLHEKFWRIDIAGREVRIPMPFKRGDILHTAADGVFVYEPDWDKSYVGGYMQNDFEDEDAVVGLYSISNWLTAEYYTEKLEGRNEKLGDISSFLKGKMKLVDFIEKCRKMK